jgi:hypothetical protein
MRIRWPTRTALLAFALLLVVSCGGSGDDGSSDDEPSPTASDATDADTTADPTTTSGDPGDEAAVLTEVAEVDGPIAMTIEPQTNDLYVAEREGRVVKVDPDTGDVSEPIIDISDNVSTDFASSAGCWG